MGKKERIIKQLNKEFYKEYNNENEENEIRQEEIEFNDKRIKEDVEEEEFELVSDVAVNIMNDMKEYVTQSGLCLCENIDIINTENFIEYLKKSPIMMTRGTPNVADDKPCDTRTLTELQESIKQLETDINNIDTFMISEYNRIIMDCGEYDIFKEYIDEYYNGKIPDPNFINIFRDKMIKIAGGIEKYNSVIKDRGEFQYNKIYKNINL
jgi:hypothetical protein